MSDDGRTATGVLFGEPDGQTAARVGDQGGAVRQHRLAEVQLVNWGTFEGHHRLPVARRGFLVTGASGSGKSSLLDAISVVLVPPKWLDLNAAARDAATRGRDRTLLSYVRGAWSRNTDETTGELATQLLRRGAAWSAVGLAFEDGLGARTTLVRVFSASRATASVDAITKISMIVDGAFDLRELEPVVAAGLNLRAVKHAFAPVFASTDHGAFADKFTRRLGISGERALRLLHKTQSTKGLTDLDTLLRDFMLDEPATFAAARRTVEQFDELREAYASVQQAKEQVEHLTPVRAHLAALQDAQARSVVLTAQAEGMAVYTARRAAEILDREVQRAEAGLAEGREQAAVLDRSARVAQEEAAALRDEFGQAGGHQIELWRREAASADVDLGARQRRRHVLIGHLAVVDAPLPAGEAEYQALVAQAQREIEAITASREDVDARRDAARDEVRAVDGRLAEAVAQLRALTEQPSNLDRHDLALRDALARAVDVRPHRLPFVAELLQVRPEDAAWQGAIERLLGGFARSVIVPEPLYAKVSEHVDATHLGRKLLYNRVPSTVTETPRPVDPHSVVHKLEVADVEVAAWLTVELSRRFDVRCVETLAEFRSADQAITRNGQIKRGRTRHEKDDRSRVDDPRGWVLGFENQRKRDLVRDDVDRLTAAAATAREQLATLDAEQSAAGARLQACQHIVATLWADVDTVGVTVRLHELHQLVESFTREHADLGDLDRRLATAGTAANAARAAAIEAAASVRAAEQQRDRLAGLLADRRARLGAAGPIPDEVRALLDDRFAAQARSLTPDTIDEVAASVTRRISAELTDAERARGAASGELQRIVIEFTQRWPAAAADVGTDLDSAPDVLAILEDIEVDGLPRFIDRFRTLLDEQSTTNLTQVLNLMSQEAKVIRQRIAPVNESLASVEFNPGTHLRLVVRDRSLPEVRDFRDQVHSILTDSLRGADDDAAVRYARLNTLVARLGSSSPADRLWRELVLDVRKHVEFRGEERDADGTVVEVHTSGEGRSGGQRVKLVTFALAAALRYQLGGRADGVPDYGTVVIDEAFDKADAQFTEVSMRAFEAFGFQMVLATPLKMVQTLSEFIGGAALVTIQERRHSTLRHVDMADLGA